MSAQSFLKRCSRVKAKADRIVAIAAHDFMLSNFTGRMHVHLNSLTSHYLFSFLLALLRRNLRKHQEKKTKSTGHKKD